MLCDSIRDDQIVTDPYEKRASKGKSCHSAYLQTRIFTLRRRGKISTQHALTKVPCCGPVGRRKHLQPETSGSVVS